LQIFKYFVNLSTVVEGVSQVGNFHKCEQSDSILVGTGMMTKWLVIKVYFSVFGAFAK
jgi:hypothetical protein